MNKKSDDQLHAMRHSLAHITAAAVKRLWPHAKFGVGPVVENGYYYDIDLGEETISEDDFAHIEAEMRKIVDETQVFERFTMPIHKAVEWAKQERQPYKLELLNDLKRAGTTVAKDLDTEELGIAAKKGSSKVQEVSFYRNGGFTDLCRGPHVASTGKVGAFKLMRIAGAYWRGKEGNPQMQRLYGVAFATKKELDAYIAGVEEAKQRDHRLLGRQLDLFTFSELVGAGLPLFTPRGTILREKLAQLSNQLREEVGFQKVWIPHIAKQQLYETSGHWAKFGDELFLVKSQETSDQFALKPMNCPHHTQLYASRPRSYRELPLKYLETTTIYRDEKSGELHGLARVRSANQDDSHAFCREDQIASIVDDLIHIVKKLYKALGMKVKFRLSFRDSSDAYLGDVELWDKAQQTITDLANKNKLDYFTEEGEAAFYGPKIDFMAVDAMNRTWQVATVQLDFVLPQRFRLAYTDEAGAEQVPIMVHCALLGSIERFLSVYIEHTAGWFPFWLAPEQLRILTVNDSVTSYVAEVTNILQSFVLTEPLRYNEVRFNVDDRNESLGRKIRDAVELKVPVLLIVGPKDAEKGVVSIRTQSGESKVPLKKLIDYLQSL